MELLSRGQVLKDRLCRRDLERRKRDDCILNGGSDMVVMVAVAVMVGTAD